MSEDKINAYQQALLDATVDACLYGSGFAVVTKTPTSFEVKRLDIQEVLDLSKFILENRNGATK